MWVIVSHWDWNQIACNPSGPGAFNGLIDLRAVNIYLFLTDCPYNLLTLLLTEIPHHYFVFHDSSLLSRVVVWKYLVFRSYSDSRLLSLTLVVKCEFKNYILCVELHFSFLSSDWLYMLDGVRNPDPPTDPPTKST